MSAASSHRSAQHEGHPICAAAGRSQASSHRSAKHEGLRISAVAVAIGALGAALASFGALAQAPSQSLPATTLLPTGDPCSACAAPAAPSAAQPPQGLPAAPAPSAAFRLNDLRLNGAQALSAD